MLARPQSDHTVNWVGPHQAGAYLSNCLNRLSLGKTASHPQWKTNYRGSSLEIPNKLLSQDRGVAQESLTLLLDREAEGIVGTVPVPAVGLIEAQRAPSSDSSLD